MTINQLTRVSLAFLFAFLISNTALSQCTDVTVASITNPGPYNVATLDESDGIRNGPAYRQATLYYPTNATPPYASIAIVPGFTAGPGAVAAWGSFYASNGIVAMVINTNSGLDFPNRRANALVDALETIRQENVRSSSPLEGKIDTNKFAVSGHSMGGGGAQLAAAQDDRIKAVIALNPWLGGNDNNTNDLNHSSPVLILSGQQDGTAAPASHANIHYNNTPNTTEKALFEKSGGNHSSAINPNNDGGNVGKIALSWLRSYLDDNDCYCSLLDDTFLNNMPSASSILTNYDCQVTLAVDDFSNNKTAKIYPNPTFDNITLDLAIASNLDYKLVSTLGALLAEGTLTSDNKQVELSGFPTGIYYLQVADQVFKIVKK